MRVRFGVILITGICGGFVGQYVFALPVVHHIISKDLDNTLDQMYNSYISLSDNRDDSKEMDLISHVQNTYVDDPKYNVNKNGKLQKTKQTAYLLVKTRRQRDKRYISYLTLCHFKICNMGRKRASRYFHMIRRVDDNDS